MPKVPSKLLQAYNVFSSHDQDTDLKDESDCSTHSLHPAPAPPPSYSEMSNMPDYITALTLGCFVEQAIASISSFEFNADRAAYTATLPFGGRLQKAKEAWHLITDVPFVLKTVEQGFSIKWDNGLPNVPYDGKNPPATARSSWTKR